MSTVQRFFWGFGFVRAGFRAVADSRSLKLWLLLPLIIDLALLGVGVYFGAGFVTQITQQALLFILGNPDSTFYAVLYYPFLILFTFVFLILFFYVVYILASVIASPFYSIISEIILVKQGALPPQKFSLLHTLTTSLKMLWISILRGVFLLFIGAFLFVASFIPGLNLLVGFIIFLLMAFDSADYALEAKQLNLSQRLGFFRRHFVEFSGMATFVGLTAFVPGLILLVMPFAVVGASLVVAKLSLPTPGADISR